MPLLLHGNTLPEDRLPHDRHLTRGMQDRGVPCGTLTKYFVLQSNIRHLSPGVNPEHYLFLSLRPLPLLRSALLLLLIQRHQGGPDGL